jgi:hypothetical protein
MKLSAMLEVARLIERGDDRHSDGTMLIQKHGEKIDGKGHQRLAAAIERGIKKATDLCDIVPAICSGNKGIPRDKMPQFRSDAVRQKFVTSLKDRGVRVTTGNVKVGQLKPTQNELSAAKVLKLAEVYLDGGFAKIRERIVVSKDNFIVDGHHRWAALMVVGPDETMNVVRVGIPIRALVDMANEFPGVEQAA